MGVVIVGPGVNFSIQITPAPGKLNLVYCDHVTKRGLRPLFFIPPPHAKNTSPYHGEGD
jgi:hypothetical protein